jgi:hypothetical protein
VEEQIMKRVKTALIALQLLVAVNAVGGGIYGLAGAKDVPAAWLEGSPFHTYTVPSLFLLGVIGGGMVFATAAWLLRRRIAPWVSLGMGVILMSWIVAQVAIITLNSWLQPVSFVAGLAITALAVYALRRPADVPAANAA